MNENEKSQCFQGIEGIKRQTVFEKNHQKNKKRQKSLKKVLTKEKKGGILIKSLREAAKDKTKRKALVGH